MNLVKKLRIQAGVTQQELANAAGTSQSTIAAYESGSKSPTLRTIERFATSLGLEWFAFCLPRMTREDHRSLAFHRAIADVLGKKPAPVISHASQNLGRLAKLHPDARLLFARWSTWLTLSAEELISRILDPGLTAREMRQVSPFSGVLNPEDRARILREFRKEYPS